MTKYIAFLRAINVGGTKVIKMDALRSIFESFGMSDAQTYIQSGNVIFEAKTSPTLEAQIEKQLAGALGYNVEVFVRSLNELADVLKNSPFEPQDAETLHVSFLRQKPARALINSLLKHNSAADEFAVRGREAYNLRRDRDNSVFSNAFIEKIFGSATTRNITTLQKIFEKYR